MKLVAYDNYCGDMIVDEDGQWTLVDDAQEVVDGLVAEVERLKGLLAVSSQGSFGDRREWDEADKGDAE